MPKGGFSQSDPGRFNRRRRGGSSNGGRPPRKSSQFFRRSGRRSGSPRGILELFLGLLLGLTVLVIATAGVAAGGAAVAWSYVTHDLPSADEVNANEFATTKIYDRNWTLLNEVNDPQNGWRTPISFKEIQDHITQQQDDPNKPHQAWIIDATVAAEDASFWTNQGVDPYAIARAVVINASDKGSSGASTITQQLVRILYPEQVGSDRSYLRKIREAIVAFKFTHEHSKTEILERYLNDIYYGNRSYGIDAASQSYFNKHPWDLTLGEASMLAGLPQSPSVYDPTQNYELAKQRQRYVLNQMVEQRMITAQEADDAYAEPLSPQSRQNLHDLAPHFVNYVKYYLEQKFGADALYRGGLVVRTSLDLGLQDAAQQTVTDGVRRVASWDANNGALVAMLPGTGEIVAMVGSADYFNDAIDGQVNVATSERQPGSSIKPITYLAAFEKGWNPGTVIFDYETRWPTPGAPKPFYVPQNYTFQYYGAVSAREALSNSLNIPAVKALDYVGVPEMIDLAHKMGIKTGLYRGTSFYGLSITLGGGEVTLLEHTNVFATLANNGRFVPYTPLLEVTDSRGETLFKLDREQSFAKGEQVVKAEHAYQVTDILSDNRARSMIFGSSTPLTLPELNRPAAAKTGTTNEAKDAWTMGYTTDLAVGVWVGNTDNHATRSLDGVVGAAPIWHDFMVKAHDPAFAKTLAGPDGNPIASEFPKPPGIIEGDVCTATGKQPIRGVGTKTEVLVQGEGPTLACNQADDYEIRELKAALKAADGNKRFTSRGVATLNSYAMMTGYGGLTVEDPNAPKPSPSPSPSPSASPGSGEGSPGDGSPGGGPPSSRAPRAGGGGGNGNQGD
jgi:penicillin-binding protein 1C